MKFMLLIRAPTGSRPEPGTPGFTEESASYRAFTEQVIEAGVFVTGDRLEPAADGVVVRVRNGQVFSDDKPPGPHPNELGGYYVLDCRDMAEAAGWAGRIPTANYGSIEVRPSRLLH